MTNNYPSHIESLNDTDSSDLDAASWQLTPDQQADINHIIEQRNRAREAGEDIDLFVLHAHSPLPEQPEEVAVAAASEVVELPQPAPAIPQVERQRHRFIPVYLRSALGAVGLRA